MGIKVVLTDKEASSKPFELLPRGWYKAIISDGEVKESQSPKNAGKPYYSLELTITEGKYEGRKVFDNVMCFEGALYSIVQLCAAYDLDTSAGDFEIPELTWFLEEQKEIMISLGVQKERTVTVNGEQKTYAERNEVKGYKAVGADTMVNSAVRGGSSLLPS
jgi:hypothetical protein